jgi:zinc D-Ala-D-Ala carboxypeptidase
MQLSRYFSLDELTFSQTARAEGINNRPGETELEALRSLCAAVLDPLREALGQPIKVTSGYRGPALNRRIKGATSSQHLSGQAADVQAPGTSVLALFQRVIRLQLPFDQIIYEVKGTSKWVHVSHRPGNNRGQILLAKFSPDGRVSYPPLTAQQALEMREPVSRSRREPGYVEMADEPVPDEAPAPAAAAPGRARKRAAATGSTAPAPVKKAAAKAAPAAAKRARPAAKTAKATPPAKAAKPAAPAARARRGS